MATAPPRLNERQQHYLLGAYRLDQDIERQRRRDFARGNPDPERTPAAEWRAMPYGRWEHLVEAGKPPTELRARLDPQLVSPGTGSTWKALAERGLVTVDTRRIRLPGMSERQAYLLPHVSLTRAGRKLARELLGEVRPARPQKPGRPEGLLSSQAFRILAAAYAQDAAGLLESAPLDWRGPDWRHFGGQVVHQLRGVVAQGLLDYCPGPPESYQLTAAGRAHYERYYRVNAAYYPHCRAEVPRPFLTPAQRAFWAALAALPADGELYRLPLAEQQQVRHTKLRLMLAQELGTLYYAPYWYPTLAGVAISTRLNRDPEDFRADTQAGAAFNGELLRRGWEQQLAWDQPGS